MMKHPLFKSGYVAVALSLFTFVSSTLGGTGHTNQPLESFDTPQVTTRIRPNADTKLSDQIGVMLQLENALPEVNHNPPIGNQEFATLAEAEFSLLEKAGVTWTRQGILWEQIQPQDGQYDWSAADIVVQTANSHHVNLLWLLGNTAPWDSANGRITGVPKDLSNPDGRFQTFVRQLVARYKSTVHDWEIHNEPNLPYEWTGTPEQYGNYLSEAYRVIKEVDPQANVVFGGLGDSIPKQIQFFQKVLDSLKNKVQKVPFDAVNFHIYGFEADNYGFTGKNAVVNYLDNCNQQIDTAMHNAGLDNVPQWLTEFDYCADPKYQVGSDPAYNKGAKSQAKFVTQQLPRMLINHPGRKIFWASLIDDCCADGDQFQSVGLVTSGADHKLGTPRPAYAAFMKLLAGSK